MRYKLYAKGGKLYVNGKRIGQVIIPTFERIDDDSLIEIPSMNPTDIINKNIITFEDFKKIMNSNDKRKLLFYPLYSKIFNENIFFSSRIKGTPIPFDFIQVQGKVLIYADGDNVRIVGNIDEDVEYYLMTRGIMIGDISRYGNLSRNQRDNVIVDSDELWLYEVVEKYFGGRLYEDGNSIVLLIGDNERLKVRKVGHIFIGEFDELSSELMDVLDKGLVLRGKIYGAEFKRTPILEFKEGKLYLGEYEVVCEYSIHNNMIKTTKPQRVKIKHNFKGYKVVSMNENYLEVVYKNNDFFRVLEPIDIVRMKRYIRVRPTDNTQMLLKYIEKNGLDFYFIKCSNKGIVYYQFVGDTMYIVGDGVCELEHIYDRNNNKIFVKNRRRIYKLKKIENVMEIDDIVMSMS